MRATATPSKLWRLALLVALLCPATIVLSQEGFGPPSLAVAEGPRLVVPQALHDWGETMEGTTLTHSFRLINRGRAPLKILRVKTTCGCTTVDHDREIAPGGEGRVKLALRIARARPKVKLTKQVTVFSNDPTTPQVKLTLTGMVRALIIAEPSPPVLSGLYSKEKEIVIELVAGTDLDVQIEEARAQARRVEVGSIEEIEKGRRYRLRVKAPAVTRPQIFGETLRLTLRTPDGKVRQANITLRVDHEDPIAVVPRATLVFSPGSKGKPQGEGAGPVIRSVRLTPALEGYSFCVRSARLVGLPEGLLETRLTALSDDRGYRVDVIMRKPVAIPRALRGRLIITTDDPALPERMLNVIVSVDRRRVASNKR